MTAYLPLGFLANENLAQVELRASSLRVWEWVTSAGPQQLHVPGGPSVRFDTCLVAGTVVSPYYDSLLGKLIVYAKTREETLRKMRAALCELVIDGIPTNIEEQLRIVEDERFTSGNYDLTFMGNR